MAAGRGLGRLDRCRRACGGADLPAIDSRCGPGSPAGDSGSASPSGDAPQPATPWFALDDFDRPAVRNGLGTAAIGGDWWISAGNVERGDYAVDGGSAILTVPKAGQGRRAYLRDVRQVSSDIRLDRSEYAADVYIDPRGRMRLSLTAYPNSKDGLVISERLPVGVIGPGGIVHMRVQTFRVKPTQLRAKVWSGDEAEPASWATSVLEQSAELQKPEAIGFGSYLSSKATNAPVRVRLLDLSGRPV